MPIVKNASGWFSVRCDCCGRDAFNEISKEDAIQAVRNSSWTIVASGGMALKDYCPNCYAAANEFLLERRNRFRDKR